MAEELTIQKLMDLMPKAFLPEKAQGLDTVIQFNLSGEGGGDWAVTIKDGVCTVAKTVAPSPKLTLSASASDYLAIITGKLNAMTAFMEGKVKAKGDLNLAMKMMNYFKLPA